MSASGYEVVRYERSHRDQVLDLQMLHWGPDRALNDRLLAWKYERNPWAPTPRLYLVFHEGQLVGMRGFYGSRWESGTRATEIPCAGDLVIVPTHRDRGVYTALMRFALADLTRDPAPFIFNLSAGAATRLGALTMGWRELGPITRIKWEKPKRSRTSDDAGPDDWFAAVDRLLHRGDTALRQHIVLSGAPRPADMAALVRRRGHDGRIRHVRDEKFFEWRYGQPTARYRFLYLTSPSGGIDGFLVLHSKRAGAPAPVQIVDCEADDAGADRLLDAALTSCGLSRIVCWRCSVGAASDGVIARHGFAPIQVTSIAEPYPTVLVLPNAERPNGAPWELGGNDVVSLANWDLRQAYGDG